MKRLALLALFTFPLGAAEIEIALRHVVMNPMGDTGDLDVPLGRGFGASAEVFWIERVSTSLTATFANPAAILFPSNPPPNDVDLGTLGIDVFALTGRWHFAPAARLSPFVGGGGAIVSLGNLDDQFGDDVEAEFDDETALLVEGGARYRIRRHVIFELGVTYMPLEAEPNVRRTNVPLPETIALDPLTFNAELGWRF